MRMERFDFPHQAVFTVPTPPAKRHTSAVMNWMLAANEAYVQAKVPTISGPVLVLVKWRDRGPLPKLDILYDWLDSQSIARRVFVKGYYSTPVKAALLGTEIRITSLGAI